MEKTVIQQIVSQSAGTKGMGLGFLSNEAWALKPKVLDFRLI